MGKQALIFGANGGMGTWFLRAFESTGYSVSKGDTRRDSDAHLARAIADADSIIISVPPSVCSSIIKRICAVGTGALVFDICSIKEPFIAALDEAASAGIRIASVHPMFGPDVTDLTGRNIIISDCGDADATAAVEALFRAAPWARGARVSRIPLEKHDALMAYVLGMPHALNIAFVAALASSGFTIEELLAAGGNTFAKQFALAERVVSQNPKIYYEIQATNAATGDAMAAFNRELQKIARMAQARKRKDFIAHMESCKTYSDR